MKYFYFAITLMLIISCSKNENEKLLNQNAWVNDLRSFSMVRFTEDGYGYDLINISDTLEYKFEDNKFLLIDKKGDSTKTLTFDVIKLDNDSFVVEMKQQEGLKLRYRKANNKDLIYGSWTNNEKTYQFLSPDSIGTGFKFDNLTKDIKQFFNYTIINDKLDINIDSVKESFLLTFEKNLHNLNLKSDKNEIKLKRTKFHESPIN